MYTFYKARSRYGCHLKNFNRSLQLMHPRFDRYGKLPKQVVGEDICPASTGAINNRNQVLQFGTSTNQPIREIKYFNRKKMKACQPQFMWPTDFTFYFIYQNNFFIEATTSSMFQYLQQAPMQQHLHHTHFYSVQVLPLDNDTSVETHRYLNNHF